MSTSLTSLASSEAVAAFVTEAAGARRPIVPSGSGTKRRWGGQAPGGAELFSTRALQHGLHHFAGDLVAVIPAGMTLDEANAALAPAGQWLPIDASWPDRATIGGIVATNDSGPRRYRHGAPRDLIVGIEVVLADGRIARAGGRVVKNVAGYDLSRLFCGSHGSLGVVTSATFKLAPLASASRTLMARCGTLAQAVEAAAQLVLAPVTPSAIELQMPGPRLLIRFETTAAAAHEMAQTATTVLQRVGAQVTALEGADEQPAWDDHAALVWQPHATVIKAAVLPTKVPALFEAIGSTAVTWACTGRVALGVMLFGASGDHRTVAQSIERLRAVAADGGGHVTLLDAPDEVRQHVSMRPPESVAVMQAIKRQFDPHSIFPPLPGLGNAA